MMETWVFGAAALAFLIVGLALGTVINDYFSTRYWEREIDRIKKMHKSEITSATVASFNKGVLATMAEIEGDRDIPND
jgi:hypothetical protein